MGGGRGHGAWVLGRRDRRPSPLVVPFAIVIAGVSVDGSGQVMDRVDRAVEAVDSQDEGPGQERHDGGSGPAEPA